MPQLLQHREVVTHRPVFHNLPVTQAEAVHLLHGELLPGHRKQRPAAQRERAVLRPRQRTLADDLIRFCKQGIDAQATRCAYCTSQLTAA